MEDEKVPKEIDATKPCEFQCSENRETETPDASNTSSQSDSYKCPVCMECVHGREPFSTRCGHVFCKNCILAAIQVSRRCPLCKGKMSTRQLFRIFI